MSLNYDGTVSLRQIAGWLMFWRRGEEGADELPYSIVLLTRKPHSFTEEELQSAGEKGWRKRFDGTEDPMYFVSCSKALTMMKAGKYVVQLVEVHQPYSDDMEASAKNLPCEEQKRAWFEHRAWVSLDLWNGHRTSGEKLSKKESYAVLAKFALQLGNSNCSAVYFPKEGWMLPNNGDAESELRRLIEAHSFQ
jgi:hypothetical protein